MFDSWYHAVAIIVGLGFLTVICPVVIGLAIFLRIGEEAKPGFTRMFFHGVEKDEPPATEGGE